MVCDVRDVSDVRNVWSALESTVERFERSTTNWIGCH